MVTIMDKNNVISNNYIFIAYTYFLSYIKRMVYNFYYLQLLNLF